MAGVMSVTGEPGGDPVKCGVPVGDLSAGLFCAFAILSAVIARERTGRGQFIDVCLFEAGVSLAVWEAGRYFATGEVPRALGSAHQTSAPYQALKASDGFFTVGATSLPNWRALCKTLGLQDLENDPRFEKNHLRHQNRRELIPLLEAVTVTRPAAEWVDELGAAGVPCGVIQNYAQVFADPHLLARRFFSDAPHATLGPVKQLGSPMRMSQTPPRMKRAGPLLGEHTAEVLREMGYRDEEIEKLRESRVVRRP
jgi:formyl-CoA transferase